MAENVRERDLVLAPNEFAFILDETKGNVIAYVGPHKTSLANTDLLKVNELELDQLRTLLSLPPGVAPAGRELMSRYGIGTVVITSGAEGALALAEDGTSCKSPGHKVVVKDTIGSGDAFTATLAVNLANGAPLEEAMHLANAAGAYVATQVGGTPPVDKQALVSLHHQRELAGAGV